MCHKLENVLMLVLTVLGLFSTFTAHAAKPTYAMGVGIESRLEHEVNPAYSTAQNLGQLYGKIRLWPWALLVELNHQSETTGSGSLNIRSETTGLGLWGRYEFLNPEKWSPFATVGGGAYFDEVTTNFEASTDVRAGRRGFGGVGGGLTVTFWQRFLVEAEGRGMMIQERVDPLFTFLLRAGIQI